MNPIIGIDFDNTIISYDDLMYRLATEWGFISAQWPVSKREIRDHIRTSSEGELNWQRLQAVVYGPRIHEAVIFNGVKNFFDTCSEKKTTIYIVSHKTVHPAQDKEIDLHQAALDWLKNNGIICGDHSGGLPRANVFLESTRQEKIARIRSLGCTHFIDDLIEVFSDPTFPSGVSRILFSPMKSHEIECFSDIKVKSSWQEIYHEFF